MPRIQYSYEPLAVPPPANRYRKASPFKATMGDTMDRLDREISHLGAKTAVLQLDVDRSDLYLDGTGVRSGTKRKSPAVALSFQSKFGPLTYPCDTYTSWEANLRAIALALEALRAVDRYGVTRKGEQYTGWAKLPAPPDAGFASRYDAKNFLRKIIGGRVDVLPADAALREAEMLTHPDRGGKAEDFKRVQDARKALLSP